METDALNEVKEQVSQGCLTRTWLLVVVGARLVNQFLDAVEDFCQ